MKQRPPLLTSPINQSQSLKVIELVKDVPLYNDKQMYEYLA